MEKKTPLEKFFLLLQIEAYHWIAKKTNQEKMWEQLKEKQKKIENQKDIK